MRNLSAWHIIVLLVVVVLLFGANRLPDLARSVGQSLKIFKNEVKDLREDDASSRTSTPTSATTSTTSSAPVSAHGQTPPAAGPSPYTDRPEDSAPRNPQV